ncbi:MAG: glycoside hydrolase family 88 protein [Planctomycetes bacterium]|nr:glycoside hydrolase family 88 protein [Planctomycetota bacterium]
MIKVDPKLTPIDLLPQLERFWARSAQCIDAVDASCPPGSASPVFTLNGRYTNKGWTEWTQGFQHGSALLQFDATGDERFLELGRTRTIAFMAPHLTHVGVHDHGFNNVSTYGNLWRLMNEGRFPENHWERQFYELALKASGAVQAARWAKTGDGTGYIYSFNGPQSLFVDTIRSCRALALAHQLGHVLVGERDERINLLRRLVEHASNTARYNIWYGEGRDAYDVAGRTAHESVFNTNNGQYRCPSTQQGYSPFSTWTRGLAWAMVGYAELLEWLTTRTDSEFEATGGREAVEGVFTKAARATCDFYIRETPTCGVPYWDTGAPGLAKLGDYLNRPADPYNEYEPIDSSAAAIAAQGLLRFGHYLVHERGETAAGVRYVEAGRTVVKTLLGEPYLSTDPRHEGLILHSVYHRPNGWDYVPPGRRVPCGESSMWGDYHAREVALYVKRLAENATYHTFFGPATK